MSQPTPACTEQQIAIYSNDSPARASEAKSALNHLHSLAIKEFTHKFPYAPSTKNLDEFLQNLCEFRTNALSIILLSKPQQTINGVLVASGVLDDLDLEYIAVDEVSQRQGLGSLLIRTLIQRGLEVGCRRILLEVGECNHQAISLYRRNGFQEISRRSRYYPSGEDALIMERTLL